MKGLSILNAATMKKALMGSLAVLVAPVIGICQTPPPPGGGFNPDQPLNGVPIDSNLTIAFLAVGIAFAVIMFRKMQAKKAALPAVK